MTKPLKILTIVGARPQFIKAAAVSYEILQRQTSGNPIQEVILHTGQHFDENMSDVFFQELAIPKPRYHLGIHGGTHGKMTGRMIEGIEAILLQEQPDLLMVYGDTNSTLAGAIAASKLHIPIVHVEAGLRSFNLKMPEEVNRIVTDRLSSLLLVPSDAGMENLRKEGVEHWDTKVVRTGDVMLDCVHLFRPHAVRPPNVVSDQPFVLCTVHRAENTDDPVRLNQILGAIEEISHYQPVIWPIHPRTRSKLNGWSPKDPRVELLEPVGYLNMVWLLDRCSHVVTDSGGLQKEAFYFQKPCITVRDETEWVELVHHQFNFLAGADQKRISQIFLHETFASNWNVLDYGSGRASATVVDAIIALHESV
jgi:UDP-GlcNAc3NAcA epimerase